MNSYSKFAWTTTPLLLVLLCVALYIVFDSNFLRCDQNNKNCDPINANMISHVENAEGYRASSNRLNGISTNIKNLSENLNAKNQEAANLQTKIAEKEQLIDGAKVDEVYASTNSAIPSGTNAGNNTNVAVMNANTINGNIKRLEIEKTQQSNQLKSIQTNANALISEIQKNKDNALNIRKHYGGRYSNRMVWIFLTALFIMLSIAAVIISGHVIFKCQRLFVEKPEEKKLEKIDMADKRTLKWITATGITAVIFSISIAFFSDKFMSITLPMLSQSILNENVNELSRGTLVFFHIVGFIGSIFLITTNCLIFRTAVSVDDEDKVPKKKVIIPATDILPEAIKLEEDTDTKLKLYAKLLRYLRTILYVGTFMLFVGILRMSFMMKWHLTFISLDMHELLNGFWESLMTVQGGFYSILLAMIYLPPTFWINGKISQLGKNQTELNAEGVSVKYTDILIRLLAIVSPLIASGLGGAWLNFFNSY